MPFCDLTQADEDGILGLQLRICCISLRRNCTRWNKSKSYLTTNLFANVDDALVTIYAKDDERYLFQNDSETGFDSSLVLSDKSSTACVGNGVSVAHQWKTNIEFYMVDGVDAHRYKAEFLEHRDLKRIEKALHFKAYENWSICSEWDVVKADPDTAIRVIQAEQPELLTQLQKDQNLNVAEYAAEKFGIQVWLAYERWFSTWYKRHRIKYVEYFNRHMTLGECGSSLAHLRLIERQVRDQVAYQLIFEDDARPSKEALPILLKEIYYLQKLHEPWDLIFLHSVKYEPVEEKPGPSPNLKIAVHRKITDAYCLSLAAAEKISNSGFRQCLFPFDDFLPALFSHHPRPDIRRLDCVKTVTLVAYTFPDNMALSTVAAEEAQYSDNNVSPAIYGDHGCALEYIN
mmetsp:Transcript_16053/g.20562  ORF Transcript_16053/g.20562 Transcript_16053/m.20562 type:complete len:402 (-) Transcript_16053:1847-3052(-)